MDNFAKIVLDNDGIIRPLIIPVEYNKGLGLMNPSIFLHDGKKMVILRAVNYTFYHSEKKLFQHPYGPLTYLHPENDIHLRTWNYYLELNDNLEITRINKIDTSKFPEKELWEFVGLEDARLFEWEGKLYTSGVRRDLDKVGTGRMELCQIEINDETVVEKTRFRIPPPKNKDSYCEKNWMPILDRPYHYVKWSNPTEVVKVNEQNGSSETVFLGDRHDIGRDIRGGSQLVPWKDYYIAITHEVDLFKSETNRKDAVYKHRILLWDKNFNLIKWSDDFSIMGAQVEFCVGLAKEGSNFLMTFGYQDNAAYVMKFPEKVFVDILGLDDKHFNFDWGLISKNKEFLKVVTNEIFVDNIYQKFFEVENNDLVVDIGSSVGPFTYSIKDKNPKHVYCFEPHKELFKTLSKNVSCEKVTCFNKGIGPSDSTHTSRGLFNETTMECFAEKNERSFDSIKFSTFIKDNNIQTIDFMKIDCEGGEYDVFNEENFAWIAKNVKKVAGEWHLNTPELKDKFRKFRDTYLKKMPNHQVFSIDNVDIKWSLWDEWFLEFYQIITVYIDNRNVVEDWKLTDVPTMEFTTSIDVKNGCVVDCVFCPQRTLQESYKGERFLSLDNFKLSLDKIPKEVRITFAGFTEPWLNPKCTDMVLYAHEKGHPISIFTTGIGMTLDDLEKIKHIPFAGAPNGSFTLHLPDTERKAKHPITDKYIKLIERFGELKNKIHNFQVMTMGTVHESVSHIFPTAHSPEMWSRAGNLSREMILKPELLNRSNEFKSVYHGDKPKTCGCVEKLYHNVILPNGDVSLCCMDYGLKNIIGNIFTQSYEEIVPKYNSCFDICKFCENGVDPNE